MRNELYHRLKCGLSQGEIIKKLPKRLELEVNKGLYGTAFNLNNDINNNNKEQRTDKYIAAFKTCYECFLPTIGYEVGDISKEHQGQHILIALHYGQKEVGTEVGEDAVEHCFACFER